MSDPTPAPSPAPRKPWFGLRPGLSRRTLLLVAIAFGVGLVLFLLLVAGQREDEGFFRAGDAPAPGRDGQVFEPLPTPDAAGSANTSPNARNDDDSAVSSDRQEDSEDRFAEPGEAPDLAGEMPPVAPVPPPEPVAPARPDASARPLRAPPPRYPSTAARRRESGTVLVQVRVDPEGRPVQVDVVQSSRSRSLDREAVRAVGEWTFSPAVRNGQPVQSTVLVPIEFHP